MGTRFIASANARRATNPPSSMPAPRTCCTPFFTGIPGNYLKASVVAAGLDPANLPAPDSGASNFGSGAKPWKDIWGAGQGVGGIDSVLPTREIVARLRAGMPSPRPPGRRGLRVTRRHATPRPGERRHERRPNIDRDGAVLTLTINRPERQRARQRHLRGADRTTGAGVDRRVVSAVILTGTDNDLRDFRPSAARATSAAMSFLRALTTRCPGHRAVEGYAVGIGVTLLQHCDFVHRRRRHAAPALRGAGPVPGRRVQPAAARLAGARCAADGCCRQGLRRPPGAGSRAGHHGHARRPALVVRRATAGDLAAAGPRRG